MTSIFKEIEKYGKDRIKTIQKQKEEHNTITELLKRAADPETDPTLRVLLEAQVSVLRDLGNELTDMSRAGGPIESRRIKGDDQAIEAALEEVYRFMLAFGAKAPKNEVTDKLREQAGMIVD